MTAQKKGFVLYFDNCNCLEKLPPEQRGYLLSALCAYAEAVSERDAEPETTRFPQLTPEARMAFLFMADAVRRDSKKWRDRRESYRRGIQTRLTRAAGTQNAAPAADASMSEYVRRLSAENGSSRDAPA